MRVAVVGPAEPLALASLLGPECPELPIGMGGTPINALVRGLVDAGHDVTLVTASPHVTKPWTCNGERLDLRVIPWRARARTRALDMFRAEREAISAQLDTLCDVDVVHGHWTYEFALPVVQGNVPHVITAHDAPPAILRHNPTAYRLLRLVMAARVARQTTHLTAVSPYLAEAWRREMRYRRPIAVIPNIIPMTTREPPIMTSEFVVLDVANDSRLKNVNTLLRAFAMARRQVPEIRLRLVGPGLSVGEKMWDSAHDRNLLEGVEFLGVIAHGEIHEQFRSASLFVHTSLEESQGMVLLEAMHYGVPVVAGGKSGGVPWTLGGGNAGTLVDVSDANDVAAAIVRATQNPSDQRAMVAAGRHLIEQRYSARAVVNQYVESYRQAMAAWAPRAQ